MIDAEFLSKIRLLAPGTRLRKALDDIVMARLGTILVFIDSVAAFREIIQAGFQIDGPFTPERLYELSKMDGAVIMDEEVARFYFANVHLIPEATIPSSETGIRHRTAERTARQTGKLVVAVSRRRNIITAYYKEQKHVIHPIAYLISKIDRALNVVEKHRDNLDKAVEQIDHAECDDSVRLDEIALVIGRFLAVERIREEIEPYIVEIGIEGALSAMQLQEVLGDLDEQLKYVIMDYARGDIAESDAVEIIRGLKDQKDPHGLTIASSLGHEAASAAQLEDVRMSPVATGS